MVLVFFSYENLREKIVHFTLNVTVFLTIFDSENFNKCFQVLQHFLNILNEIVWQTIVYQLQGTTLPYCYLVLFYSRHRTPILTFSAECFAECSAKSCLFVVFIFPRLKIKKNKGMRLNKWKSGIHIQIQVHD